MYCTVQSVGKKNSTPEAGSHGATSRGRPSCCTSTDRLGLLSSSEILTVFMSKARRNSTFTLIGNSIAKYSILWYSLIVNRDNDCRDGDLMVDVKLFESAVPNG